MTERRAGETVWSGPHQSPDGDLGNRISYRYDAFLSYSHTTDDALAPALERGLQSLARPERRPKALSVYRDKTNMPAMAAVWPTIERNLAASRFLILLASPLAAASPWVERELTWWLDHRSIETLMVVLTDGEIRWDDAATDFDWATSTAVPRLLAGRFRHEPLWVDLRFARTEDQRSLRHGGFRDALLTLASPLHGRPRDEIDGDDVRFYRRRRRLARTAFVGVVGLCLVISMLAAFAVTQRNEARRHAALALSRGLAARAEAQASRQPDTAMLLALEAIHQGPTVEAWASLQRVLSQSSYPSLPLSVGLDRVNDIVFSESVNLIAATSPDGVWLGDADSGQGRLRLPTREAAHSPRFSPDGRMLAVMSGPSAFVWDTTDGRLVRSPMDAGFNPDDLLDDAMAFSEDGRWLTTVSNRYEPKPVMSIVRRWSLHDESPPTIALATGASYFTALSPHGDWLATDRNPRSEVWHLANTAAATPDQHFMLDRGGIPEFSADNTTLVVGGASLRLGSSRRARTSIPGRTYQRSSVSADGRYLYAEDGRVWALSPQRPRPVKLGRMASSPRLVRFSADSRLVAFGSQDGNVHLWNPATGQPTGPPVPSGAGDLIDLELGPNGQLATVNRDGTVRLTALTPRQPLGLRIAGGSLDGGYSVPISPDGRFLVTRIGDTANLWSTEDGRRTGRPIALGEHPRATFNTDGSVLLVLDHFGDRLRLRTWDTGTAEPISETTIDASPWAGSSPVVNSGLRHAAAVGSDGTLRVWDLRTGDVVVTDHEPPTERWIRFSPNGDLLVAYGQSSITVWDLTRRSHTTLPAVASPIALVQISPDGRWLAILSNEGTLHLWDRGAADMARPLPLTRAPTMFGFSPDSRRLVVVNSLRGATLWDVRANALLRTLPEGELSNTLDFGPDGRVLWSTFSDAVLLYDVATLDLLRWIHLDYLTVNGTRLSPDDHLLVVGGHQGTSRLIGTARDAEIVGSLDGGTPFGFSADGRIFVTSSVAEPAEPGQMGTGQIWIWRTPDQWIGLACAHLRRNLWLDEWNRYVGSDVRYTRACEQLPAGVGAPAGSAAARYVGPYE